MQRIASLGLAAALAAAALLSPLIAWAQAKKPPDPMPLNQAPPPKAGTAAAQKSYYDTYQASYRQHLRRESCLKDEDMVEQYCVKKCRDQFIPASHTQVPRICRSVKPLPPGQLPTAFEVEKAKITIPPKAKAPVQGD
jgi:hypothetical protein